ncbi:MAG: ABC transporter substrate-binding protein [Burkholderiaceae bacterium]
MKLLLLYRRRWWLIYLPLLTALFVGLAVVLWLWNPLPPHRVVIGTGPGQSSYLALARVYASRLEHRGIVADIVTHDRPQDALLRMANGDKTLDVTFAQGLYADLGKDTQALAVVGHEIVWVFAHEGIRSIAELRGKRIAAAAPGSSSQIATLKLLKHAQLTPNDVTLSEEVGDAAIAAISEGRVDAVVHVATGDSQTAATLVRMNHVHLLGVDHAGLLATREPHLRAVVMPQGSIELRGNLPAVDLPTMVTQTHLLVRPDLHPALQRALLDVAGELHVMTGFLEGQGIYPTTVGSDFPISAEANRHLRGDTPWLETLLPFGTAQWTELVLFALFPTAVLGLLILMRAPRYIDWRVRAALQHFYGELKFLEEDMARQTGDDPTRLRPFVRRMDQLERQVAAIELPDRYADRWYTLREHLQQARSRLRARQTHDDSAPRTLG